MLIIQRAFKNITFLILSSFIIKSLGVMFSFYAARKLGIEQFGFYNFTWAYIGIFEMFSDFGMTNVLLRSIGKDINKANVLIGVFIPLRIILSFITVISTIFIAYCLSYQYYLQEIIYIASLLIFSNTIQNLLYIISNIFLKIKYFCLINILLNILYFTINVILLNQGYKTKELFINAVIINSIFGILSIVVIHKYLIKIKININLIKWKKLIKESLPFAVLTLLSVIYFKIDIILLSKLTNNVALGLYTSVYKFLESLLIISSSFSSIILPIYSKLVKKSPILFINTFNRSLVIMFSIGIIFAIIFTLFAKSIIYYFLGSDYLPASKTLIILIWSVPLIYISNVFYNAFYSLKMQNIVIKIIFFAVILNILLNYIMIPFFSYEGSAIATLITEIFNIIFCISIFRKYIKKNV